MAKQSASSGNWNTGATWVGGAVPGAGETWEIMAGHTVTVAADLTNSPGAGVIHDTGQLTMAATMSAKQFGDIEVEDGGAIYASRGVSSVLRCGGVITLYGATGIDYGTAADPISNTAVGAAIEFVCTSDNQAGVGFDPYAANAISLYGATQVMQTTLAAQVLVGATTIVLTDDLALRSGTIAQASNGLADMIVVGHNPIQTANGTHSDEIDIYLVGNYVAGTKTVTLADAGVGNADAWWPRGGSAPNYNTIDTQREIGTPVWRVTTNVVIRGTAYNKRPATAWQTRKFNATNATFMWCYETLLNIASTPSWNTLTFLDCYTAMSPLGGATVANCVFVGCYYATDASALADYSACAFLSCQYAVYGGNQNYFLNCVMSGCHETIAGFPVGIAFKGCNLINGQVGIMSGDNLFFDSCTISGFSGVGINTCNATIYNTTVSSNNLGLSGGRGDLVSCTFTGNNYHIALPAAWVQHSCTWSGAVTGEVSTSLGDVAFPGWIPFVSYDHGGVADAYYAWMCGGTIVTEATALGPFMTSRKLTFARATFPTFMDIPVLCPANQYTYFEIWLKKSANGMTETPRVQLVLPELDPFLTGGAAAAETIMVDNLLEQHIALSYKPTYGRQVILRVRAMHDSGNLWAGVRVHGAGRIIGAA